MDLLPAYPDIYSDDFYQKIYRKKEFNDLKIPKRHDFYESHQLIVARFISHWTLYQSLIVLHDTGTGKSGVAAATFTGLKRYNEELVTIYITHSETLVNNFKEEIFKLSPILYEKDMEDDESTYKSKRNKILKNAKIYFYTNYQFAKLLQRESMETIIRKYRYMLIILDEVHHLVNREIEIPKEERKKKKKLGRILEESVKPYDLIKEFLRKIEYKKLLLMTATPMRNSPKEIAPLLNLVFNEDIAIGDNFESEYFNEQNTRSGIPELKWKPAKSREFLERIRGLVSVVKQNVNVPIEFVGTIYEPMKYFRLHVHIMGDIQTDGYNDALNRDSRNKKGEEEKK